MEDGSAVSITGVGDASSAPARICETSNHRGVFELVSKSSEDELAVGNDDV